MKELPDVPPEPGKAPADRSGKGLAEKGGLGGVEPEEI